MADISFGHSTYLAERLYDDDNVLEIMLAQAVQGWNRILNNPSTAKTLLGEEAFEGRPMGGAFLLALEHMIKVHIERPNRNESNNQAENARSLFEIIMEVQGWRRELFVSQGKPVPILLDEAMWPPIPFSALYQCMKTGIEIGRKIGWDAGQSSVEDDKFDLEMECLAVEEEDAEAARRTLWHALGDEDDIVHQGRRGFAQDPSAPTEAEIAAYEEEARAHRSTRNDDRSALLVKGAYDRVALRNKQLSERASRLRTDCSRELCGNE